MTRPLCIGCNKHPDEISEYLDAFDDRGYLSADDFVICEEGTFNPATGHFLCTECYITAGMPSAPGGWRAP